MKIKEEVPADDKNSRAFGNAEEQAIISLAFDQSEFFSAILPYLKPEYFIQAETQYVFTLIKKSYEEHSTIPTRGLCLDMALERLTADDPHKEIAAIINRESNPREVPIISAKLTDWAKKKAYGLLYSEEAIRAHEVGDYEQIEEIVESAKKIVDVGTKVHFFFDEIDQLFIMENDEKLTTGFPRLDQAINQGGPSRREVFCFMAPTGVGKSIALCNAGATNIKRSLNVLHITMEMSWLKTSLRYMGCFSLQAIRSRLDPNIQEKIRLSLGKIASTYGSKLMIVDLPPNDVSVDTIHAIIDAIRKMHGIKIDVLVIDYLELMSSRSPTNNKDDYTRQKSVSTEILQLAKKENVLLFTATQTNRSGNEGKDKGGEEQLIDINKVAESYGKTMPVDYLVTINQSKQEYDEGRTSKDENAPITHSRCRLYIVKNRNGPKYVTVSGVINYETMSMIEQEIGFDRPKE